MINKQIEELKHGYSRHNHTKVEFAKSSCLSNWENMDDAFLSVQRLEEAISKRELVEYVVTLQDKLHTYETSNKEEQW